MKRLPAYRRRMHSGRVRAVPVWWWGWPGNPPGMRTVTYDDYDDDELDQVDELLAPAVCHFCGAVTRDGLMVFPKSGATWPVCEPCMQAAFKRNPKRPELRYARSPN